MLPRFSLLGFSRLPGEAGEGRALFPLPSVLPFALYLLRPLLLVLRVDDVTSADPTCLSGLVLSSWAVNVAVTSRFTLPLSLSLLPFV